jgi:hypothetical protein
MCSNKNWLYPLNVSGYLDFKVSRFLGLEGFENLRFQAVKVWILKEFEVLGILKSRF